MTHLRAQRGAAAWTRRTAAHERWLRARTAARTSARQCLLLTLMHLAAKGTAAAAPVGEHRVVERGEAAAAAAAGEGLGGAQWGVHERRLKQPTACGRQCMHAGCPGAGDPPPSHTHLERSVQLAGAGGAPPPCSSSSTRWRSATTDAPIRSDNSSITAGPAGRCKEGVMGAYWCWCLGHLWYTTPPPPPPPGLHHHHPPAPNSCTTILRGRSSRSRPVPFSRR